MTMEGTMRCDRRFFGVDWLGALALLGFVALGSTGCEKPQECVDKSKKPLEECRLQTDKLQSEIVTLKAQLAQKQTSGCTVKTEPVDVEGSVPKDIPPQEGSLSQQEVVKTIRNNTRYLRQCYERSMKKNPSLRRKITLTISFKIHSSGVAKSILIRPNPDYTMTDCMKKAIRRWKFPAFTGQPIDVETPLRLSPKR